MLGSQWKKWSVAMVIGAVAVTTTTVTMAQEFPSETLRIVVPWRAGGGTDSIARALATPMESASGQSVLVENVTGGAGNAGMIAVKTARANGYTMLLNGSSDITAPIVFRDVPFSMEDYQCVGGVYQTPAWILANTEKGFGSFADFIAAAKAAPGKLSLGVTALATPDHVLAEALVAEAGIEVRIIPFNGGAPLKKALLGNQVDAGVLIAPVMLNEVKAGVVNVLVSGGSLENINYAPLHDMQIPKDYGVDLEIGAMRGVFLPKDVPADVVAKVEQIVGTAAQSDEFKAFGENFGFSPVWMPGPEFCEFMAAEDTAYRSIN